MNPQSSEEPMSQSEAKPSTGNLPPDELKNDLPEGQDLAELKRVAEAALTTPWHAGHLCDDTHSCNCRYVLAEHMMGAVCEVFVQDGTPETEHEPPLKEAKANQRFIATFDPPTVLSLLATIASLQAQLAQAREIIEPMAAVGRELLRAEAGEEWKLEIPDDKAIFGFCGETITAGTLRRASEVFTSLSEKGESQ